MSSEPHTFSLVFEDEHGDFARCSCGWQGFDFAQGKEAFAGHLATLDAARAGEGLREAAQALVDEWDAAMTGDMPFNGHYQKQALARLRAALHPDTAEERYPVALTGDELAAQGWPPKDPK